MTRTAGTLLLAKSVLNDSLTHTYEWLNYARQFVSPDAGDIMVQGIWDQYPRVPPAVRQLQMILNHAPPERGQRLLDVGCGMGGLTTFCLQHHPGVEAIVGIDLNANHVDHANHVHAEHDNVLFFHDSAESLSDADDHRLAELVDRKFHRIYMIEVTPDLTLTSFRNIFDQCFRALTVGGTISLFTLTIDLPCRTWIERFVMELLVRPGAPTLKQIRDVISRYDCDTVYEDVTRQSTLRLAERLVEHPDIVQRMLLWPVSTFFLSCVRTGIRFVQRGGYACTVIHVRKRSD